MVVDGTPQRFDLIIFMCSGVEWVNPVGGNQGAVAVDGSALVPLINMPPHSSRTRKGKRKRPPEDIVPSSLTLEVISSVRRGKRASKKRAIEKLDVVPPSPAAPPR